MAKVISLPTGQDRKLAEAFVMAMVRTGMNIKGGKGALTKRLLTVE